MDYEQKYKDALERARKMLRKSDLPNCGKKERSIAIDVVTYVFPELSKNEDEEIVAELKGILAATVMPKPRKREIFAWLEKQGGINKLIEKQDEQKSATSLEKESIEVLEHFVRSLGESGYISPYDNRTKLIYTLIEQLKQIVK